MCPRCTSRSGQANHELATTLIEQPHLREFQAFYQDLPNKRDIFYMFFSSGLLHWALTSLRFVPAEVNVVLIGANLTPQELGWIPLHIHRPFHHIRLPADDKTVWEFLFRTNRYNFGWLDIDCFVLNPELFSSMTQIKPDDAANCTWSFQAHGLDILLTYFLFLNVDVLRRVSTALQISPCTYRYEESTAGRTAPYGFCRQVTPDIEAALKSLLPAGPTGCPVYLSEADYYDTLQVYQLVARSMGYHLSRIRPLVRQNSNELVHVGRVSYYQWGWANRWLPRNRPAFALLAQADYVILHPLVEHLPAQYGERHRELRSELERLASSTSWEAARATMRSAMAERGVAASWVDRITEWQPAPGPKPPHCAGSST